MTPSYVRSSKDGIILEVTLLPRSSRSRFAGLHGDRIKITVTSPPVDGKANESLIEFLAKFFETPKRDIRIVKGETSRQKTVLILGEDELKSRILAALDGVLSND